MEELKKSQRILGLVFDIRDTADLLRKLFSIGGVTTMIVAVVNWVGKNVPPLSLILFGVGLFMFLLVVLPRIIPRRWFELFRKVKSDWMTTAFARDTNNFPRCIFIHNLRIDWTHLRDTDSYFLIHCDVYSSSVFRVDIGKSIDGHIFYKSQRETAELERVAEITSPIDQLERSHSQHLIMRQWLSESMMNRVALDGGNEITLVLTGVNIWVNGKYPDGSVGPRCRLSLQHEYKIDRLPTQVELGG